MSIELKNVTKYYGDYPAVFDVSFTVNEGELIALLGPSGSGKTTVLRLIAGLEVPDAGEIYIRGKKVNNVPVQQRNIGFVFQSYALFKSMTVFENIAFGLKIKKWRRSEIESRVKELLSLLDLERLEERYPHQLSGGQRQRVAIARALAPKPNVLLLDEPFGAVDAKIRQELREWLVHLHSDLNVTTIFVTHDQEEAMEVANRIAIFSKGRLEQIGSPREVYEKPANEFVARFIGVMNVLELEVRDGVARLGELEFPNHGQSDGQKIRIGFRPYAVQVSSDITRYRYRAILRHTYFLGVMLRLELELPSGITIKARMSKEEYTLLGLEDGKEVSFQIRQYRVLSKEGNELPAEVAVVYDVPFTGGEGI
ncbi:MAG: sulfate/molybdate ABC transporter ATP-binding protein [Verrucomicrobiia bacterium]|jgi:sulfate transport system ATP-binding protein